MAHNTAQAIAERRLKPVYDFLDSNNPEQAARSAEKILKKFPTFTAAKALKALAYLRMGRDADALTILEATDTEEAKHDEITIQALVHCYKECSLPKRICLLYERAIVHNPSEQNLSALFMAHVRVENLARQLSTVQRLWKDFPQPQYFYWYMITLIMQARSCPEKAKLSYTIAQRSIEQFIQQKGEYKDTTVLDLHLTVLDGVGEYRKAKNILTRNETMLKSRPSFVTHQQVLDLLLKAERWHKVAMQCGTSLVDDNDDWKSWITWIDTLIIILEQKSRYTLEDIHKIIVGPFIKLIKSATSKDPKKRGPFLAKMEMSYRLKYVKILEELSDEFAELSEVMGKMEDNLLSYIKMFHKKPCCYSDIEKFLPHVENKESWFQTISELLDGYHDTYSSVTETTSYENSSYVLLLKEKMGLKMGLYNYTDRKEKFKMINKLLNCLEELKNLSFDLKEASSSEHCGGELSFMCTSELWKAWSNKEENDWLHITEAALICEHTTNVFKNSYPSQLALCRFYSHIGAIQRCRDLYKDLDIKSVQQETLGYIIFHQFELVGQYAIGIKHHYEFLSGFFTQAEKELGETLASAVKSVAVRQMPGVMDLCDNMKKSTLECANDVMTRYLSALFCLTDVNDIISTLEGDPEVIDWNGLCDNRDMSLLPYYGSEDFAAISEQEKINSQREFVDITQLRHYICKSLAYVALSQRCPADQLRNQVVLLKTHLDYCRNNYSNQEPSRRLQSASPCRLGEWVHQGHFDPVMRLLGCAVEIAFTQQEKAEVTPDLLPTADELKKAFAEILPSFDGPGPYFVHNPLFKSSRALQSLATCTLLVSFIKRRILSCLDNKKTQTVKNPAIERCQELAEAVQYGLQKLNEILVIASKAIEERKPELIPKLDNDYDGVVLEMLKERYEYVCNEVTNSYATSFGAMTGLLAHHFNVIPYKLS